LERRILPKKLASHRAAWTKQDLATLKKMAPTRPIGLVAHELGRTEAAIRGKAGREGISFGRPERSPYGRPTMKRPAKRK
jgi:hypothetical protein